MLTLAGWLALSGSGTDESSTSGHPVPVAARDLPAGHPIGEGDVVVRRVPVDVLPHLEPSLARSLDGRVVVHPLEQGAVIAPADVADSPAEADAARAEAGRATVAVARIAAIPDLETGGRVELWTVSATGGSGRRVARDARVVAVDDDRVVVAVSPHELPATTAAAATGAVVVSVPEASDR